MTLYSIPCIGIFALIAKILDNVLHGQLASRLEVGTNKSEHVMLLACIEWMWIKQWTPLQHEKSLMALPVIDNFI